MGKKKVESKKIQNRWICEDMTVKVIAGNDKGQTGKVLRRTTDRVVVQGVNVRKKHVRPTQANPKGGILDLEMPIHISNVAPCTEDGQRLKLKARRGENGSCDLVSGKAGEETVVRSLRKAK